MTYKATEPKFLWILLFIITLTYAYSLDSIWKYIAYLLSFFFFVAMLMTYEVKVEENQIVYSITIIGMKVMRKRIEPENIEALTMIDVGRTIMLIELKKGFRIKLQRFSHDLKKELETFAENHKIHIEKPSQT